MIKLVISAVACLALSLSSYSQSEYLFWLEGRIVNSDLDSIKCDIYMWNHEIEEWGYMITYTYGDTYAVSFDYPEYYVLVFSDSNTEYQLHVRISEKSFEVVNIGLDTDVSAVLECSKDKPGKYLLSLID